MAVKRRNGSTNRIILTIAFCCFGFVACLSAQTITTIAGTGKTENNGDKGSALQLNVGNPFGVEIGPDGSLYVTDDAKGTIYRIIYKK